jgi:ABC-2 type transport system permease protein
MSKFLLLTQREIRERISQKGFWYMLVLGPIILLVLLVALLKAADEGKQELKVLIADPGQIMGHRLMAQQEKNIHYYFIDDYLDHQEFYHVKDYKEFDVLINFNHKILNNKKCFVFYREHLSIDARIQLKFQVEKRMEELIAATHSNLTEEMFSQIKQGFIFDFRDLKDPKNESKEANAWAGFTLGAFILFFVGLYGMTIFRATVREKSNRIVEVLLASVRPEQLMLSKIAGIGLVALMQLLGWALLLGFGFWILQNTIFLSIFDPSNWGIQSPERLNPLSSLVFEQLNLPFLLLHFVLFFVATFMFFGSLFAVLGARSSADADGQQFLLPLIFLVAFGLLAGIYAVYFPNTTLTEVLSFLPFSAPVLAFITLAKGATLGAYTLVMLSLALLLVCALVQLKIAGRWYRTSILKF